MMRPFNIPAIASVLAAPVASNTIERAFNIARHAYGHGVRRKLFDVPGTREFWVLSTRRRRVISADGIFGKFLHVTGQRQEFTRFVEGDVPVVSDSEDSEIEPSGGSDVSVVPPAFCFGVIAPGIKDVPLGRRDV